MAGNLNLFRRIERCARRRVRNPMQKFFRGVLQDKAPSVSVAQQRAAVSAHSPAQSMPDAAGAEAAELARRILGQQTMLTHHSLDRLDRSLLLQGRIAANQGMALSCIRHLGDIEPITRFGYGTGRHDHWPRQADSATIRFGVDWARCPREGNGAIVGVVLKAFVWDRSP